MEIRGPAIREYRTLLGLSQRDFAAALGLSQALVSLVEVGRYPVSRRLLRQLRLQGDQGVLKPTFGEFLERCSGRAALVDAGFALARPIPLEAWHPRIDLSRPPDAAASSWFFVAGLPEGARAFHWVAPPAMLQPDSVVAFAPAALQRLEHQDLVLIQLRRPPGGCALAVGVAHLGRALVTRQQRRSMVQFEAGSQRGPVVELSDACTQAVFSCFFRGRYQG